ncbi:MAG: hypothetical protein WD669_06195 [Pirellulales bacterium]
MITSPAVRVFKDEKFHRFVDYDSGAVISDLTFRDCEFQGCLVGITKNPQRRTKIRNVSLINCSDNGSSIGNAIVEDVLVENFKAPGLFQTFGAVFKHVILRGRFDRLMICNYELPDSMVNPPYQYEIVDAFREANAEYYQNVDWALDISEADFKSFELRGVPTHLVRRDPDTQIVVTRAKALKGEWKELEFEDTLFATSIEMFLQRGEPSYVLIAPKRHRKFLLYLHDLQLLREAGIAEPD